MAVGKNMRLSKGAKGGKKVGRKISINPFTKKDWYNVKAPSNFKVQSIGITPINRTPQKRGRQSASERLKGRVFEASLADLQMDGIGERNYRKFQLISEEVVGGNVLTSFHGMSITNNKLNNIVRKWHTLIEANVDAKTTDGYQLRVFCIGYTHNENPWSKRKTSYASHAQVKAIRKKMVKIMSTEISTSNLNEVVNKLIPDSIAKDILKATNGIFPLHDVHIRKVKVLKKPRPDLERLLEMHSVRQNYEGGLYEDFGEVLHKPDGYEPPIKETV